MNPVRVFTVSKDNRPSKLISNAKILGAVVLLAGGVGAMAYDKFALTETPVTAIVVREVHYEMFAGNKSDGRNIVNLKIEQGKDAGQDAVAQFHFSSSAEEFKKGDRVSGMLSTSRIFEQRVVDDLSHVTATPPKM